MKVKRTMKNILLHISFLMIITVIVGCSSGIESWIDDDVDEKFINQTFSKKALAEDLDYLQEQMPAIHPVFEKKTDQKEIKSQFESFRDQIKNGMNRKDFFRLIGKINPYFKDGHSFIFPLLAEGTYAENNGQHLFRFGVSVNGQSLYINRTYTHKTNGKIIKKGTKILSINDIQTGSILNELSEYGHGETANLRMHMSTLLFRYWLCAVYDWKGEFLLSLEYKGEQNNIVISNPNNWESKQDKLGDNWLEVLPNQIAYLRLGTFDVDEDSSYEDFIRESFAEIRRKKLSKLVIDVRGNTGGQSDAGAEVIKYLTDKSLNQASSAIEKLNKENNGLFGYKGEPGEIINLDVIEDELIEPVEISKRFKGETIVLIDEMTYSAGIVFATTIQDHKLAKLVGQPTGGHANQTGNMTPFYLPNTRLLVLAPSLYITRPSGDRSNRALQPDVVVDKDVDASTDRTLELSLDLF
ncbi:S41 family peptidase [Winogradskyella sp.]|uniref:S41 family peptidase n=1 Tax=Winogradskyella sp. TaxID=1883156 RepID=UPI002601C0E1|nr:S41 family peptidase [Winogradskyella sp.]